MDTHQILKTLALYASHLGPVRVTHHERGHWTAGFDRLVETRGDGLRHVATGFGKTEQEAVANLWDALTEPGMFFSVAQYGTDTNYGWTGEEFVLLPSTRKVGINGVLNSLRGHIPDLPASYAIL